jgi:major membrane immunogen (membrane-anchored lipoprotein)
MTIAMLNDQFRRTLSGGRVVTTRGFAFLPIETKMAVIVAITSFDAFTEEDDPCGEHDFIAIDVADEKVFAKIDYYNRDMSAGSEDPADPEQTTRVMTIMLASEY